MSSVQSFATWAAIAAKADTFPKLPAGSIDVFLTKAEILAKGGGLIKIDGSYSDNSFVAIEHVSQYVVEWRYTFEVSPTSVSLPYEGTGKNITIKSFKRKYINNIDQNEQVDVGFSVQSKPDWTTVSNSSISASQNGETTRSGTVTWKQSESGKTASCAVSQAAGVVSWRYVLEITGGAITNWAGNTSGSAKLTFNSRKYKQVNGVDTGENHWVAVDVAHSSGSNFVSIDKSQIGSGTINLSTSANGSLSARSGIYVITQSESDKTASFTCNQSAGDVGWNYYFSVSPGSMSFGNRGDSKSVSVTSYRRQTVNGSENGVQEDVAYSQSSNNSEFSASASAISVGENMSESSRSATVTYTQSGSGKTGTVSCSQAAADVSWNYYFSASPTSCSFAATGGSQSISISSYKRKVLNGKEQSGDVGVDYSLSSAGGASVSGNTISIGENVSASGRSGTVSWTQSESDKSVSVSWSQSKAKITYEYVIEPSAGSIGANYTLFAYKYEYINGSHHNTTETGWSLQEQNSYNETTNTTYSESKGSAGTLYVNVKNDNGVLKSTRISGPSSSIYGISVKIWHHGTSSASPLKFYLSNP